MSASAATLRRQAIERAQAAARAEYLQARADTEARVLDLLDLLADDVSAYLMELANGDGELPADAQVLLEAYLSQRLQAFAAAWQAELGGLLEQAARIGAGIAAEGAAAVSIAQQAQLFLQQFVAADGLQLSDRLWRLTTGTQADLVDLLRTTIAAGADAARTADALLASGRSVPAELIAQRNAARATSLGRAVRDALTEDGVANARFNLIRLLRTEGNRSYTEAYVGSLSTVEGIAGVKFTLSPRHPRPDVCFRAGTDIATREGPRPIETLAAGDWVLTHLGRWRRVLRLYRSQASGPLVRLRFQVGSSHSPDVVMTPNHPVLTPVGWIQAGDLRTGDHAVCAPAGLGCSAASPECCASRTPAAGSLRSAPDAEGGNTSPARCGADQSRADHTPRSGAEGDSGPTPAQRSGAGTCPLSGYRPSSSDCLRLSDHPTSPVADALASSICRGDACRSSDCSRQSSARTHDCSTSPPSHSSWAQSWCRMWRRSLAWLRGLSGSTRCRRKSAAGASPSKPAPEHRPRTSCTGESLLSSVAYVEPRMLSVGAEYSPGETVYNLEVEDDHTYVAGGIVVHNCDLHAAANLHGLGPGVYPLNRHPYPAHPMTLSFLQPVFVDEITDEDRAGQQSAFEWIRAQPAELQDAVLGGQRKGAAFRAGQLSPADLRTPWREIEGRG